MGPLRSSPRVLAFVSDFARTMERPKPMPQDLDARLARAAERCASLPGVVAVVLFGSVARGEATPWSDVDLGVFSRGPISLDDRVAALTDLHAIFERDVDLVDLAAAPLPLRAHAVAEGRALVVNDREAWADFATETTIAWLDFRPTYERALKLELERFRGEARA